MKVLTIILIIRLVFGFKFNLQYGYKVVHDHIIFDKNYNREYLKNFIFRNTKYNRTAKTIGGEAVVLKTINTVKLKFSTYKWMTNDYKPFPSLDNRYDGCLVLRTNFLGFHELLTTNGNITDCPVKPGYYYVKDWKPVDANCPPLIPLGNYKFVINCTVNENDYAFTASWFGSFEKITNKS